VGPALARSLPPMPEASSTARRRRVNRPDPIERGNRGAIVRAAAKAIARSGVRGMRIEEVAADADVSPALLYYHFENRAGLVRAALEHASELAPSTALRERRSDGNGYERLEAALLRELDDEGEVREAAVVWGEVSASAVFDPELRDAVRRVNEEWRGHVTDGIRAGVEDGSIRSGVDADAVADTLISLIDGLCARWLAGALERERGRDLLRATLRETLRQAP
jgi:AcrR family transcriptional regulator